MSYKAGIVEAIAELKDRTGSSTIAIKKVMQEKLPKDKKWMNATFLSSLKKGVADGDFVQVKASYKLSAEFKKSSAKKVTAAAAATKKAAAPKKAAKKTKETAAASPAAAVDGISQFEDDVSVLPGPQKRRRKA
jgi:histone H1/5